MLFFALNRSDALGRAVAAAGGFCVAKHEEREFDGGEHKARPLTCVHGKDVWVLHTLNGEPGASANDKLCRLLFFLAACRENGAASVTAIAPYLAYSRKDRQTKPGDPVTTRYVAALFEAVQTDCVVTIDVHNLAAFQNAFRCRTLHLDTGRMFAAEILARRGEAPIAVVSPDGGGIKRAELLRETLVQMSEGPVDFGFMEKRRSGGAVSGSLFAGDVSGREVWIVDDMIVGGGTMLRAALACRAHGAARVHLLAAHPLFSPDAAALLDDPAIDSITVTDTAPCPEAAAARLGGRLHRLSVAPMLAEAILQLHHPCPNGLPAAANADSVGGF
ncbi:MAG: ribose-phosphate diphosphokinase [Phaeovulum sp.]|uniref:ribose-phosphate diphosphokinase n=2 Tax=Phaeovulum sp. TaxID=2934796 RepID=UPI00272F3DAE|nr:ribose-phosphate diphosphokinase [Phaeovulum sp.]MDP2063777.1 ribose-phosphate diphosphokinase [Phaeovulum sp.]